MCFFAALLHPFEDPANAMFSLQKLMGKEDQIFTLLEASAEEARASVNALTTLGKDLSYPAPTAEAAYPRHRARQITDQLTVAVYTTYITAIQREDIQELANAIYRISKSADKFMERAFMAPQFTQGTDFSKQTSLLAAAADIVFQLVKSVRSGMHPEQIKDLVEQLRSLENQADKVLPSLYQDLYSGRYGAVQAVFLKDLYELLEKAIDRCRSAGNIVSRIVLKNS